MQIALVFCALFALVAALPRSPIADETPFASVPLNDINNDGDIDTDPEGELPEGEEDGFFVGTFNTQVDHTRPRNAAIATFVRCLLFFFLCRNMPECSFLPDEIPLNASIYFQQTQTYHANLAHHTPDGAFYVYIKDAGETNSARIERGLMVDTAAITGAALFTFDQRYFGQNNVTA